MPKMAALLTGRGTIPTHRAGEPVAQSVEHVTFNHGVVGSKPTGLTNKFNNLDISLLSQKVSCPHCVRINAAGERLDRLSTACHWIALPSSTRVAEFALAVCSASADLSGEQYLVLDHLAATIQASAAVDQETVRRCAGRNQGTVAVLSPRGAQRRRGCRGPRQDWNCPLSSASRDMQHSSCPHAAISAGSARAKPRR